MIQQRKTVIVKAVVQGGAAGAALILSAWGATASPPGELLSSHAPSQAVSPGHQSLALRGVADEKAPSVGPSSPGPAAGASQGPAAAGASQGSSSQEAAPKDPPLPESTLRDPPRVMDIAGVKRTFYVHLPPSYKPQKPMPLVILLHGAGGTPDGVYTYTRMGEKADKAGFILVCPEAAGEFRSWSVGFNSGMRDPSDVTFIRALMDWLEKSYAVDPCRVFVAGHSSGGMMAYRLAAELADRITAIGVVAATIGAWDAAGKLTMISRPSRPVSVIAFHGTEDPINPYSRGDTLAYNSNFLPVSDSITFWVRTDGCSTQDHRTISPSGRIVRDGYSGGTEGSEVVLYSVVGGDHWWPGDKDAAPYVPPADEEISATDTMWDFFARHDRRAQTGDPNAKVNHP